ncbi:MAG: hypothetical protein WB791_02980 [Waddliaceae bacterium]
MNNNCFQKICLLVCAMITIASCVIPMNRVEAKGEGAIALAAAGVGALCGAAIASKNSHRNTNRNTTCNQTYICPYYCNGYSCCCADCCGMGYCWCGYPMEQNTAAQQNTETQQSATTQQKTMNFVLSTYHPAKHDAWVQYVIVDCSRVLNPTQQNQLISVMNDRRTKAQLALR